MEKKPKKPEIPPPPEADCWLALDQELALWEDAGLGVRFFLRDDDAIEPTQNLHRLVGLCETYKAPLLMATIPASAKSELGKALRDHPLVTAAVHGYAHANHSPRGEKTCELGRHRPLADVLGELREGKEKLADMFDGRISGLLVPPWNRIHDEVLAEVQTVGFEGVSAHTWLKQAMPLPMVNTHVDIIHWSGGGIGREHNWVLNQLVENLRIARAKGGRAVGLLTHHLVHDEKAWSIMERLFEAMVSDPNIKWVSADALLQEPSEPLLEG